MRKLATLTSACVVLMRCSLMAQTFTFSANEPVPENTQQLIAQISSEKKTSSDADLNKHFHDLSALCSGDILIFGDGKTLCGELVDMPNLINEQTKASLEILDVSAIIFDSEKDPNLVQYVLRNGDTIANPLSQESFRFSVEYLENNGEQRVQVFYVSPKDIRYIIIGPRQPNTPPGIRSEKAKDPNMSEKSFNSANSSSSRVVEAVELASLWYYEDSHSMLSEATSAVVLSSKTVTAMHDMFSDIVSYYAELGAAEDDPTELQSEALNQLSISNDNQEKGLLFGPKALFSTSESFEPFNELAFEETSHSFDNVNTLASAGATSFSTEFELNDLQAHKIFVSDFNVHFKDEEDSEENDDPSLSGIKFIADNQEMPSHHPLPGIKRKEDHIAFLTDSCRWFEHKYQCTDRCEGMEWPPQKKNDDKFVADYDEAHESQPIERCLALSVLSDGPDKVKQNEIAAIEALLMDAYAQSSHKEKAILRGPPNPSMIHIGDNIDITSYPVSNQDYYQFIQATNHQPPSDWINGVFKEAAAHAPVVNITYHDAIAYAKWSGQRLPTYEELSKASSSLDVVAEEFKEWTSTPSIVDNEYIRVYRQKDPGLLLQKEKYAASNIGFRCVKDVGTP